MQFDAPSGALERASGVMASVYRFVFLLFAVYCTGISQVLAQDIIWYDATDFEIEGKGWVDTANPFDRLPESAQNKISSTAWRMSKNNAGIAIRFVTDADVVNVRWSLTLESLAMPHMAATAVSGVDLYTRYADNTWWFVGNGRPHKADDNYAVFKFSDSAMLQRECLLYLPLYNGIKSLEIGVPVDANIELPATRPESLRKPLVVYGTSITQGACASRPGMAWTNILGRLLDRPVINLGFSASGSMEPPIAEVLAELEPAAYVIDCTWNMGDSAEVYLDRTSQLVQTLREVHPVIPIFFVGQSFIHPEAHPTSLSQRQEAAVKHMQERGVEGLIFVPGEDLIGSDGEGTVDEVHLNDLGMDRMARYLYHVIRDFLTVPATAPETMP